MSSPGAPSWPTVTVIPALLVDVSPGGFRALHQCSTLTSGLEVRFRHEFGTGKARVMWSRISPAIVESGFLVLEA